MPEWVLVIVLLTSYPAGIDTVYKGGYTSMIDCFDDREVLVKKLKLSGPQATCIEVGKAK